MADAGPARRVAAARAPPRAGGRGSPRRRTVYSDPGQHFLTLPVVCRADLAPLADVNY